MASRTLLDELELPLAQCIDVEDSQALVRHAVPGLDGDFLQRMGRRAARVAVTGVVTGPESRDGLERLRDKLRGTEPIDFVADIATATRVTRVLVEELDVRELAGRPERFEYAFLLREYNPPPPPEVEDPPDEAPPEIDTETGTLVVEVIVEGEPDFDMGQVTVTAEGPAAGPSTLRTLTEREGNRWTQAGLPPGRYVVRGAVASPAMSDQEEAEVGAGQTAQATLSLARAQGVARAFVVTFRFDSAFVEPCMRGVLRRAAAYAAAHPAEHLVVLGHTDRAGSPEYNQSLSERRARAVFACLDFANDGDRAVAEWTAIRQRRTIGHPTEKDSWGAREYQQMLQELGYYPGEIDGDHGPLTNEAVRAFRCRKGLPPGTQVDDEVWAALIRDYLADAPPTVPSSAYLQNCPGSRLEWLGAGEQQPLKETEDAHRPSRRVELLFVTETALPCTVPVPDTWGLPAPGHTADEWCLGPGDPANRACFLTRGAPAPPRWTVEPAEPAIITVRGTIVRETDTNGVISTAPAPNTRFVLIASDGEFKQSESPRGVPAAATTGADGSFTFPGKRAGVYVVEVQAPVLTRLADAPGDPALGPTVCKALLTDAARMDVVILRDPLLREIRLPVIAHLMTALHPTTRAVRTCPDAADPAVTHPQRTARDEAAVRDLLTAANRVWGQGRVRFELRHTVGETFATAGVNECHVTEDERNGLFADLTSPGFVNLFLFGSVEATGEAGVHVRGQVLDGPGNVVRSFECIGLGDRVLLQLIQNFPPISRTPTQEEAEVILAHELGHYLALDHVTSGDTDRRLMLPSELPENRRLIRAEVDRARASDNARDCGNLEMTVTGAVQIGRGGHRFAAIRDPAAPPVVVETRVPAPMLNAPGSTFTMTGGDPGATPTQRTVARTSVTRTEVIARWTPAPSAGGTPRETYAAIHVLDFDLVVDGAQALGNGRFLAITAPGAEAIVRADVFPRLIAVPDDLAAWQGGEATDDPLRRRVPLATAGETPVSVTIAGVTRTATIVAVTLRLDVDADRDGTVGPDEGDRATWTFGAGQRGAVMLCNLDDDDTTGVEDAANAAVDGAADAQDLAPLVVRATGALPAGVTLSLVPAPRDRVRVFASRTAGAAALAGPAPLPAEAAVPGAGTADVELGMEALTFPDAVFDGLVTVALVLRQGAVEVGRDTVVLRVAPFVMPSHLDRTETVYVMEEAGDNDAFIAGLAAATAAAGVALVRRPMASYGFDRWVQDTMEVGVNPVPGRAQHVALDAVRERGLDDFAHDELLGPDFGFFRVRTPRGENTFDSHGNLEVSPPVTVNGREFRLGRIYYGEGRPAMGGFPPEPFNPEFLAFLNAQAVQSPFAIDTSWLAVGHVDEFLSTVPASTGRAFRLVVADTPSCVAMLRTLQAAGRGGLTLFTGHTDPFYGERTIDDILVNTVLLDDNRLICQPRIEAALAVMVAELGLDPAADVLRIPSLFEESRFSPRRNDPADPAFFEALIPGVVNLLCITGQTFAGHHLVMARPFGPVLNGVDQVEAEVRRRFATLGYTPGQLHFIDDFESYHMQMGEVHCGTNSRRRAPATPWWEQTEF